MKKQQHTPDLHQVEKSHKGKKSKQQKVAKIHSYEDDYEFDSYAADEWEDTFRNFKYQ